MNDNRIRVLFADDSATIRSFLEQLVTSQPDLELVGQATTGHDAVHLATELQPDVVLMDIHMPGMNGIQGAWLVSNRVPQGAVIMATSEQRPDFLAKAVTAGAMGYVLKPFGDGTVLLENIRRVYAERADARSGFGPGTETTASSAPGVGRTIAVVGSKGGVGKTSIAVGVALALQQHAPTVLMDADFMFGDAAIHLDLTPQHSIVDLVPFVDTLDSITLGQVVEKHSSGMDLLPRPSRPEQADTVSPDLVRSVVSVINSLYGFVVVDTQLSYDERMLAVLDQADVFLVVLAGQLGALRNTRHFLDVAKMVGYPDERMCFVLNHVDAAGGFPLEDVMSVVETRRIWQIPNEGSAVAQAINLGAPLTVTAPQSPYSRAIWALADHVRVLASSTTARALD